jgi:hypothetical protein
MEGRACLKRRRGQAHVAVAIALYRERECVALLAGRVGVRPLAGVGCIGGAGGDVANWDALVRKMVQKAAVLIHPLAGPFCRADVDGHRAARAVLAQNVKACQPVAFEGSATTDWCMRVSMCARAGAGATGCNCAMLECVVPL